MISRGSARVFRRLLGYLRPHAGLFAFGLVCMTAAAFFDTFSLVLLIPFLRSLFGMGPALPAAGRNPVERLLEATVGDLLAAGSGLAALRTVCLILLAAFALKNLFLYGARLLGAAVEERVERDLRDHVYAHLQRLPLGFFAARKTGQLVARVLTDTREARPAVSSALADALRRAITAAAYLAAMAAISWRLTLLALLLAPVYAFVLRPVFSRLRRGFRAAYDRQGELLSVLQETVSGIRLVKAYGGEEHEGRRFRERSADYARSLVRTRAVSEAASPISETVSAAIALAVVWVGASLVLPPGGEGGAGSGAGGALGGLVPGSGILGPEQFVAFVVIAARLIVPVKSLARFPPRAQAALAAADRFFEVLDQEPEPAGEPEPTRIPEPERDFAPGGERPAPPRGHGALGGGPDRERDEPPRPEFREEIRYEDVWFEYEPGEPALRDVSLRARPGERIALVGPSGAGKSTVVDLLPRFLEPDSGRITLDGRDLRTLSLRGLRSLMGIVSQDVVLFNDSAHANIAYGEPDRWTAEEVEAAARAARAHEFIRSLPDGYGTRLGDRGVRLSGGQRQRIGVARALLRDPPILILDEATSSVDAGAERRIQEALDRAMSGRTVFVIAHRLSTIRGADRILVMEDGRIVERGTHRELYGGGGLYRQLCDLQIRPGGFSSDPRPERLEEESTRTDHSRRGERSR